MGQEIQLKLNNNNVSPTVEKVGDGNLQGFTATDLTGAANELKNTLTQLDGRVNSTQSTVAYVLGATTAGVTISGVGVYVIYNNALYTTTQSIASTDTAPYTGKITPVVGGGLNSLISLSSENISRTSAITNDGQFVSSTIGKVTVITAINIVMVSAPTTDVVIGTTQHKPTQQTFALCKDLEKNDILVFIRRSGEIVISGLSETLANTRLYFSLIYLST